jgi:hypothetical protein
MQFGRNPLTFRRITSPPFSGSKRQWTSTELQGITIQNTSLFNEMLFSNKICNKNVQPVDIHLCPHYENFLSRNTHLCLHCYNALPGECMSVITLRKCSPRGICTCVITTTMMSQRRSYSLCVFLHSTKPAWNILVTHIMECHYKEISWMIASSHNFKLKFRSIRLTRNIVLLLDWSPITPPLIDWKLFYFAIFPVCLLHIFH